MRNLFQTHEIQVYALEQLNEKFGYSIFHNHLTPTAY